MWAGVEGAEDLSSVCTGISGLGGLGPRGEGGTQDERVSQLVCLMLCRSSLPHNFDRAFKPNPDTLWAHLVAAKMPMTMSLKSFLF